MARNGNRCGRLSDREGVGLAADGDDTLMHEWKTRSVPRKPVLWQCSRGAARILSQQFGGVSQPGDGCGTTICVALEVVWAEVGCSTLADGTESQPIADKRRISSLENSGCGVSPSWSLCLRGRSHRSHRCHRSHAQPTNPRALSPPAVASIPAAVSRKAVQVPLQTNYAAKRGTLSCFSKV